MSYKCIFSSRYLINTAVIIKICYFPERNEHRVHFFPLWYVKRILTFVFSAIYCSEYVKIFSGDGTLEYHKEGCCPNDPGSFVEIPFMQSEKIKVNILLTEPQSRITSHFVILKYGLHSGTEKCYLSLRFKFAQSPYFLHSI